VTKASAATGNENNQVPRLCPQSGLNEPRKDYECHVAMRVSSLQHKNEAFFAQAVTVGLACPLSHAWQTSLKAQLAIKMVVRAKRQHLTVASTLPWGRPSMDAFVMGASTRLDDSVPHNTSIVTSSGLTFSTCRCDLGEEAAIGV
jgi:hypothetical protein